jgi:hypothetical protein
MKSQIDKIINFILGETPPSATQQFSDLNIPSFQTNVLKIADDHPSGAWKADPSKGSYFEYKGDYDGFTLAARYFRSNNDPNTFARLSISFGSTYYWRSSEKYGDRSEGSSQLMQKACGSSYDKFLGVAIKNLGPPIDKPVTETFEALDMIQTCQRRGPNVKCVPEGAIKKQTLNFRSSGLSGELIKTISNQGIDEQTGYSHWSVCGVELNVKRVETKTQSTYSAASLAAPLFLGFPSAFFNTGARNFPV